MASLPPELPGKTLGGIYLATYETGSVLEYHELIVISALTRYRRRLGAWVSHIYVDDPRSVAGGREIWGLPKQLAEFTWDEPSGIGVVRQGEQLLCTLTPARRLPLTRLPVFLPAFSQKGEQLVWFRSTATARLGLAGGTFGVPSTSPFAALGFGSGLAVSLRPLQLRVHAPVRLT